MNELPIIFSAAMVRAILADRKTQTRRLALKRINVAPQHSPAARACPFACMRRGHRLWVREAFGLVWPGEDEVPDERCERQYRANLLPGDTDYPGHWPADEARADPAAPRWRSPIQMPRWASRITLEVENVRRQRLLDIGEADCRAEGIVLSDFDYGDPGAREAAWRSEFAALWDSLHDKPGERWEDNPEVVAITFKRLP